MNSQTILAVVCLAGLAACGSTPTKPAPPPTSAFATPDSTSSVQSGDLRVSPLDMLEIKVFGAKDLDGQYQVDPSGQIKLPLIGIVEAKGYTVFELANLLEQKLSAGFLQHPQVSVRLSEINGQLFTVEGAIGKPGMYPVRGPLSLLQAVALSGGPTDAANPRRVVIFRTIEGRRQAAGFDLLKIRSGEAADPPIYGNDIIVMDGNGKSFSKAYDEVLKSIPLIGLFAVIG